MGRTIQRSLVIVVVSAALGLAVNAVSPRHIPYITPPKKAVDTSEFVPLDRQDTALWSQPMMNDAEKHLRTAARFRRIGRYQLEAAIQSIHAGRAQTGSTDWKQIALLYEGLVRIAPGIGSLVGRAVALAQAGTPADGFAALEKISADRVVNYQPYWAARGGIYCIY